MKIFSKTAAAVITNTMLYCPKCQQTYEEGVQRFCPNDNARLLSAPSAENSANQSGGVFTSVLNRKSSEEVEKFSSVPKFSQVEPTTVSRPSFRPPTSKIFKPEPEFELELELPPKNESKSFFTEPLEHLIKPDEVASGQSPLTDEEIDSADDPTFDQNSPTSLIEQTIQNRYHVVESIAQDESGIAYLAEEKTADDEKVVARILNDDDADDSSAGKILAEERDSLAQLNHPNIAKVIESGELSGGAPYLVTEYVEGSTVKDYLEKSGQFNALRAARIIRQTADALGEAHQNGVLHRRLKPENIVLTVDENGMERVKLTGFGESNEKLNEENLLYKSPEQVEGKTANFTSDGYSLAVIAYQMLTNRLPFKAASVGDLLKAQREGLLLGASDLRFDLLPTVDEILKKALAFNPFDRYEKVRDFGDEFFGEIIANAPLESEEEEVIHDEAGEQIATDAPPLLKDEAAIMAAVAADEYTPSIRETNFTDGGVKATEDLAWEKRSPEPPNESSPRRNLFSMLGVAALLVALLGVWYYFINRPTETFVNAPSETVNQNAPLVENSPIAETNTITTPTPEEIEAPPPSRAINPPPDTVYFQNGKENLKGEATKNFLGFSLYYPKDWRRNEAKNNYLDVSKNAANGMPIEQMLVSYYNSKGTFKSDAGNFPALVKETNTTLKKILPNYKMISDGRKTVNNGWQAYEVQFQGTGKTAGGEAITIWGKRLFIPTAIRGMKNGYVITMLASSLSKDVNNAGDVGVKGELSSVLETFEPKQNF